MDEKFTDLILETLKDNLSIDLKLEGNELKVTLRMRADGLFYFKDIEIASDFVDLSTIDLD